jgi:hypothetical protein
MKTSELTGAALDWAVAKCEDEPVNFDGEIMRYAPGQFSDEEPYTPSNDWTRVGPIIEREKITLEWTGEDWVAYIKHDDEFFGPTPLIAAMRCYVASKLGQNVDIPKELT